MIFTQRDYAKARARFSAFYNLMSAALRTETFLFFGCGRSDPDLTLLLEEYAYDFSVAAVPHYYLTAIGMHEDEKSSLRLNRNLKVIEYDPVNVEHSGLVDELKNLGEQVEAEREELIQTRNW
ncbi:SIR2 family protein [Paracoccus contaminans]